MRTIRSIMVVSVALGWLGPAERAYAVPRAPNPQTVSSVDGHINEQSRASAAAWNRGDLNAFLLPYASDVVVVRSSGRELGVQRLKAQLQRDQAWAGPPLLKARVEESKVKQLSPKIAVQTALVVLSGPGHRDVRVWVTSIWERRSEGWRVVHEQSS